MQWAILILYGLYHTFDQWTRVLLPFSQWQLEPRPDLFHLLLLNSIGNIAVLIGSFFIAQIVSFFFVTYYLSKKHWSFLNNIFAE